MKVVSKLQKERLTKDVRYQEFNELTLDQKACEGSTGQGLVLCQDALTGNACPVQYSSSLPIPARYRSISRPFGADFCGQWPLTMRTVDCSYCYAS